MMRSIALCWLAALAIGLGGAPATAQVRTIDPNQAIDGDLAAPAPSGPGTVTTATTTTATQHTIAQDRYATAPQQSYPTQSYAPQQDDTPPPEDVPPPPRTGYAPPPPADEAQRDATTESADTYSRDDLLSAAEGVFGKGAEGLAGILEKILKDQGRPVGYIAGREASGAFIVGLRYGSGIMYHKIEGQMPVYWTGPSVGFDVGGDANKVFVLVYNLYDTADLFKRYPQGEGHLYFVGGFSASYLRRGNVVLIPVRLGVGWRAGINVGYMKFSRKSKWSPF